MSQGEGSVGKVFVWNPEDQNDASQNPCKKQGSINTCAKEKDKRISGAWEQPV